MTTGEPQLMTHWAHTTPLCTTGQGNVLAIEISAAVTLHRNWRESHLANFAFATETRAQTDGMHVHTVLIIEIWLFHFWNANMR